MAQVNPYLNFNGNAEDAFNLYKSVFGGDFALLMRFKDVPHGTPTAAGEENKIMHVALPIGGGTVLMASDVPASYPPVTMGNNISISINVESEAEADRIFNALSAGGKVLMKMEKTFWGAYFGMFTDKFEINWMVNYDYNQKQ